MPLPQIDQIIESFVRSNLSPKKRERDMITQRYEQLQSILSGRAFQTGSYARHTATTPVHDLDTFYVLPDDVRKKVIERKISPEELTLETILDDLATALSREYGNEAKVIAQPHSVGIFFNGGKEFSIDVVPAQPADGELFWIPETAHRSIVARRALYASRSVQKLRWIKSDPKGYIDQATELDKATNGLFRKVAKLAKRWRQICQETNNEFLLKSFHVEIIVTELIREHKGISSFEAIHKFFSLLPSAIVKPQYRDKADSTRFIDSYVAGLTKGQRESVLAEHEVALPLIEKIQSATTEAEVLLALERLLRLSVSPLITIPVVASSPRTSPVFSKPYSL